MDLDLDLDLDFWPSTWTCGLGEWIQRDYATLTVKAVGRVSGTVRE